MHFVTVSKMILISSCANNAVETLNTFRITLVNFSKHKIMFVRLETCRTKNLGIQIPIIILSFGASNAIIIFLKRHV